MVRLIDFRYLYDALIPDEALEILYAAVPGRTARIETLKREGYPCYTTSARWLGYADDRLRHRCRKARNVGFTHVKFKVGHNIDDDIRRLTIAREELGDEINIMIDANQVWEVDEAIDWAKQLSFARPFFIEEPTSPDDVAGYHRIRESVSPIKVATGEMYQNQIMFKQFIVNDAIDIVQIDSCRLGGLNEVLAVMLMAAKYHKNLSGLTLAEWDCADMCSISQ